MKTLKKKIQVVRPDGSFLLVDHQARDILRDAGFTVNDQEPWKRYPWVVGRADFALSETAAAIAERLRAGKTGNDLRIPVI